MKVQLDLGERFPERWIRSGLALVAGGMSYRSCEHGSPVAAVLWWLLAMLPALFAVRGAVAAGLEADRRLLDAARVVVHATEGLRLVPADDAASTSGELNRTVAEVRELRAAVAAHPLAER